MANNRLILLHRPTGRQLYFAKRMGFGWYEAGMDMDTAIREFFDGCIEELETGMSQDDFELLIEDNTDAPKLREPTREEYEAAMELAEDKAIHAIIKKYPKGNVP